MTQVIFAIILATYSINLSAKEYRCTIDTTPVGMEISEKKIATYIKDFRFDSAKKKVGTKVTFGHFDLKMWVKDKMIITVFKDLKRKIVITTKSDPNQETIYLKISPDTVIECLSPEKWNKKNSQLESALIPIISDQSDLSQIQHNLAFTVDHNILFKYSQVNANDKMRTIIFQDGKIIRNSYKKDRAKEWCAFQVEIKLDEDTVIYRKTKLPPTRVQLLKNNTSHYVVSYSFVDFASGKRNFHTSRYTPFSLECQIPTETKLTYQLFRKITGNHFILAGSPQ